MSKAVNSNQNRGEGSVIPHDAYLIIIGAMKCGTTSLFSWLENHPEICPACTKEPEFFSAHQGHRMAVENYDDLWHFDCAVHRYALEASTGYTKYPTETDVPKKMSEYGISPWFIYIVRNPFDRIESHFDFMKDDNNWSLSIDSPHLIMTSNYYLQLKQYTGYFARDRFLILDFDKLCEEPQVVLQQVYSFLSIRNWFPGAYSPENVGKTESPFISMVRQSGLGGALRALPWQWKESGKRLLRTISPKRRTRLTQEQRRNIRQLLGHDMASLHREYGIDVSKWGFDV